MKVEGYSTPTPPDQRLAALTRAVYERQAARFDAERARHLHERAWLDRFLALVPAGGRILDLGCGTGDPIAAYMTDRGFSVVGLDASEAMLAIARKRSPAGDWRQADMRQFDLSEQFDAIIGWDSFFHLTPPEQRETLPRIARHMKAGAALLLTVGHEAGSVVGHVGGEPVYHASLAPSEYSERLSELGIDIVAFVPEDPDCDGHSVLLAKKESLY